MASPEFYEDYPAQEKAPRRSVLKRFLAFIGIRESQYGPEFKGGTIVGPSDVPSASYIALDASLDAEEERLFGHMDEAQRQRAKARIFKL